LLRYSKHRNYNYNTALKRIALLVFVFFTGAVLNLSGFNISDLSAVTVSAANDPVADPISYARVGNNELRGVWIATVNNINFPSKAGIPAEQMKTEIDDIVKTCKEANLNAIFFQVRPTSDALYDSAIFPTSQYLTGNQGDPFVDGFDPLKYIVQKAHENNIEIHAWINPYRITQNSHDLNSLAANNPARKNPQWVVKYADGKMYYNPGLPETRELIANGVLEIVRNYDVDGIHFDDYFYPYPVAEKVDGKSVIVKFDDDAAFAKYGAGYKNVDDFRRASVNKLVENVYNEIKKIRPEVKFGIAPFGIWANDSVQPTGSKTGGLSSYSAIYSDAKAWIEGGYIDYICPQLYWSFGTEVARFDILVRWWSAVVDGTGVDLYIGHGVHNVPSWKSELEIPRQVEYARSYMGVAGSVFFGYQALADNSYNVKDKLAKLFESPRLISKPADNGKGITVGRPPSGSSVANEIINIMGGSNPLFPVYYKGEKVTRTKSGYFSINVSLAEGRNTIYLSQNNSTLTYVLNKGKSDSYAAFSPYVYPQMTSYGINILSPVKNIIASPGDKITVSIQAPSKSAVTAKIAGTETELTPVTNPPEEGTYMTEVYRGTITLPAAQPQGKMLDLGNIIYTAVRGNSIASISGVNIKLTNESVFGPCEIIKDYAAFKIASDSDSYDDYLFASVGMRDNIIGFENGYYQLGCGGFVSPADVALIPERTLLINKILSAAMEDAGKATEIRFGVTENVPVDAKCKDGVFYITLFNTPDGDKTLNFAANPIFKSARSSSNKDKKTATYTFDLIHPDNFYGFEVVYEGGFIVVKVKNPIKKIEGNLPLKGLTIVIDPGHGGSDTGAIGFLNTAGKNEKDLNLEIALALRQRLLVLGAEVIMTREKDETLSIPDRMAILNKYNPDLMVSPHHNSVPDYNASPLVRGYLGLWCNDAGRLLAKACSRVVASELNRVERDPRYQAVGVLRNYKFPSTVLEMSFITNPDEYEFANSPEAVPRSADAIANGIVAWIDDQQVYVK